jgi:outer membrane protein assembly factor BamA/autotransporter translocation and assembly factor TamB
MRRALESIAAWDAGGSEGTVRYDDVQGSEFRRSMSRRGLWVRMRRGLLWAVGLVVVLLALVALALETSAGRSALLRLTLNAIESRTGLVAQAEGLDVAIRKREVSVRALSLSHPGSEPLARIALVRLGWPLGIGARALMPESVDVEGVRIHLSLDRDGRSNLPRGGSPGAVEGAPMPLLPLRVSVRDAAITVSDRAHGLEAEVAGLSLQATGSRLETAGTLDIKEPLRWRFGNQAGEIAFTPAVFQLDRTLTLKEWGARSSEGSVRLSGTWTDLFGAGGLGLAFAADLDLGRVAARMETHPPIDGALHLDGRISGVWREPRVDVTWDAKEARAGGHLMALGGQATVTGKGLDVRGATVRVAGGSAEGSGRLALAAAEASQFAAHWSGLDLATLLAPTGEKPPIRGVLAGHLRASWPGLEWRRANGEMVLDASEGGNGGQKVAGSARLDVRGGKWALETKARSGDETRLFGQLAGQLGTRDLGDTSMTGRLDLEVSDLRPLAIALQKTPVAGQAQARLLVSGTLASPHVAIDLQGQGLRVGQNPAADLSAQGTIDRTSLAVEAFDLHGGSAHAEADGRLLLANGGLEGRYELDLPDLSVFGPALPKGFDPQGAVHGKGSLAGTATAPSVTLSAVGSEVRMAGQSAQRARVEGALEGSRIRVDAFELDQPQGKLSVSGDYDRREGQLSLEVHGRSFEIEPLPAGLAGPEAVRFGGKVDVDFDGGGPKSAPKGRGRVTVEGGEWEGRSLGPLAADLTLTKEGLHADLSALSLSAHAEATVDLDPRHAFTLAARLEGTDLATVTRVAGLDSSLLTGTVSLGAKATGSMEDVRGARVALKVDRLAGTFRGRPMRIDHEAELERAPGELRLGAFDVSVGAGRLRLDGALDARGQGVLKGSFQGRLGDFADIVSDPEAAASDAPSRFDGTADVSFVVSGPPERPRISAQGHLEEGVYRFDKAAFGLPERPPVEHVNVVGGLDAGVLRVDRLEAAWSGARLLASGEVTGSFLAPWLPEAFLEMNRGPASKASIRARIEGDAGLVLAPFLSDSVRGSGKTAVLTADLESTEPRSDSVHGEIRLEGADLVTSDFALHQEAAAALKVQGGRLTLEGATWTGPQTKVHLSAEGTLGPLEDPLGGADLDAQLTGGADLRLLQAFAHGVESGGTATFRAKVVGKPAALKTDGEIELQGAALRHRPTRMALDGFSGKLRWGAAGFQVEDVHGSLNGGPMEVSGGLQRLESGTGFEGAVRFQVRNAFLEWPPGLRAGLRANVALEPADDRLRLSGSLRIQDGAYRTREYFSLQVMNLVNRFSAGTSRPRSRINRLRLDLNLKSNEDVQLDAVDARMAVGIDLHLGGSVGAPEIGGRLTAGPGGQLFVSGRTYDVDAAFLDFTRGAGFDPYVQARATTRVSDYSVVADVAGPATRAQTRFASTPPLAEQDIVALLTSGRTVGAGGTAAQSDAFSMASGGMLGKTGERLGLDSLKIDRRADPQSLDFDPTAVSSEADPASRLTFSKRLATRVSATFSRSLTKAGSYTWFVAWKPRPSFELRVVQRDDQTGALEFRHDVTFGGVKPANTAARRRRRRRLSGETVTGVKITGDPIDARPSDLKLREGQAFDYDKWLDDRDHLEAKLAAAGYDEGRVLASRDAPVQGQRRAPRVVALVYEVRRGPKTTLTIVGVPSAGELHDRIERAWRLGDFPTTIEDEALTLARAHLYGRGFLRAQVKARVSSSPEGDVKTLTVHAEPGEPVTSKEILFEGNARVSTAALEALVRDARRAEVAWLQPDDLREAVLAMYKSEGLLTAKVEMPKLTFVGDDARLIVKIDEGPVVPISAVSVTGAIRVSEATVLSAAALVAGQPFKPKEVDNAKARVEAAYRALGYNEAIVRSRGRLDAVTGAMKIELVVKEGPREVTADVEIVGVGPKAQARIRDRLQLKAGEPVVLDEWTEARRRIYETGLFQSVDLDPATPPAAADDNGDRSVKATLSVERWPALRLRYGLQALTGGNLASNAGRQELQAGAVAEVSRQTVFGHAASVGVGVQLRQKDQEARAYLSLPRTLGTKVRSSLFFTAIPEHADNEAFGGSVDVHKTELTWEERVRATRKIELAGAYKIQWNRFDPIQPVPGLEERQNVNLARLVGTALFDARNDLIDTSRGAFSSASYEWGASGLGSDFPLTRTFLQQFAYLPIRSGLVFGLAGRAERASGRGSAYLVTDRLQAGGANTVRGYSEDALTSRSVINLAGGSTTLLVLNAELRFTIHGPVRAVLFGDGAVSRARFSDETTRETIWSTGLGLRYVTPVGILRFDYGIPLDLGFKPARGRVYFSLGQVF